MILFPLRGHKEALKTIGEMDEQLLENILTERGVSQEAIEKILEVQPFEEQKVAALSMLLLHLATPEQLAEVPLKWQKILFRRRCSVLPQRNRQTGAD